MFTGIVEAVGELVRTVPADGGLRLLVAPGALDLGDVQVGDSIAVNGVCLTVAALEEGMFHVDVSQATLDCARIPDIPGAPVNLEQALRLSDRLGGHLVSGHVDGIGEVVAFEPRGDSRLLRIQAPAALVRYIALKGSVAVDGVSLTVNALEGNAFEVNLIAYTLAATTLGGLQVGTRVNLEVDLLARYVERLLDVRQADEAWHMRTP